MDLEDIVEKIAIALKVVDESTGIQRESRSGSGAYILVLAPCGRAISHVKPSSPGL